MTLRRKRTAILISGRGSNMRALIERARSSSYPAEIVLVLSSRPDAAGLAFAKQNNIACAVVDHKNYASREEFERSMQVLLELHRVELICLAGFMRLLTPWFVSEWEGRLLNIHPALLPAYPGLKTHERAFADGVKIHGCTVHFVGAAVDQGPIIAQVAVPVLDSDTPETLAARVLAQEHKIYQAALASVAEERLRLEGNHVLCIDRAIKAKPLQVPPQSTRGKTLVMGGGLAAAILMVAVLVPVLWKAVSPIQTPGQIVVSDQAIRDQKQEGGFGIMLVSMSEEINEQPDSAKAYYNRGLTYGRTGLDDQAIADFSKAIELEPGSAAAYFSRGVTYDRKGLYDQAVTDFTKAIELKPYFAKAYNNRGVTFGRKGIYDQAIADFNKAIELEPGSAEAYFNRGVTYGRKGSYDQTIANFTTAIQLRPGLAEAYNGRAWQYHLIGLDDLALADANRAVALAPKDANSIETRAEIYENLGKSGNAIADYRQSLSLEPGRKTAQNGLKRLGVN